jgi:hypothetical protein
MIVVTSRIADTRILPHSDVPLSVHLAPSLVVERYTSPTSDLRYQ